MNTQRVAYLGPIGTFGHQVAEQYFSAETIAEAGIACSTNREVVEIVAKGKAQSGVVPLENSTEGPVGMTISALYQAWKQERPVFPYATVVLPVVHNLIGIPGAKLEEIKTVMTHPQANGQCHKAISRYIGEPVLVPTNSTAEAVRLVMEKNDPHTAAIASKRAAELYGAQVLQAGIQDRKDNRTRFLILSNLSDHEPTGKDQTLLMLSCRHDAPGSLVGVLEPLRDAGLNATMVVSMQTDLGKYDFCLGFEGHRLTPKVAAAINQMKEQSDWLHLFGSYPLEV